MKHTISGGFLSENIVMDAWLAIEESFLKRYPGQTSPKHYGTLMS